jgi:hypothetical protein
MADPIETAATRAAFLEAADAVLRDKVLPALHGDARFAALMVASALGQAAREHRLERRLASTDQAVGALAPGPNPFSDPKLAVVVLIRRGLLDADPETHLTLLEDALTRTAVTRPQALSAAERERAGLQP